MDLITVSGLTRTTPVTGTESSPTFLTKTSAPSAPSARSFVFREWFLTSLGRTAFFLTGAGPTLFLGSAETAYVVPPGQGADVVRGVLRLQNRQGVTGASAARQQQDVVHLRAGLESAFQKIATSAEHQRVEEKLREEKARLTSILDALIDGVVQDANERLAQVERIKQFRLIGKELDHEDGELTATQKVKRRAMEDRCAAEIEAMYS